MHSGQALQDECACTSQMRLTLSKAQHTLKHAEAFAHSSAGQGLRVHMLGMASQ